MPPPTSVPAAFAAEPTEHGQPAVGAARVASTAAGEERHHDPVAGRDIRHAGADLFDDARRLVTEQHRQGARPVAVDDAEIGVAHPAASMRISSSPCRRVVELGAAPRGRAGTRAYGVLSARPFEHGTGDNMRPSRFGSASFLESTPPSLPLVPPHRSEYDK